MSKSSCNKQECRKKIQNYSNFKVNVYLFVYCKKQKKKKLTKNGLNKKQKWISKHWAVSAKHLSSLK